MADSAYLRYPHLSGDLITFTAEDDVWLAPLGETANGGGRAWRLTADRVPVLHPRLNPSATHVAWTSTRDAAGSLARGSARETYAVAVDGGEIQRLTHWGDGFNAVRGWLSDDEVLVLSRTGQHNTWRTWAFGVPLDAPARRLPYGPAGDVALAPDGAVLVGTPLYAEPSRWKRYGGGTGGKIWYSPDGAQYERILDSVGNHLVNPMWVAGRVVFLSDHEDVGALYSALPDGSDLRRHTPDGPYYARHATTDGTRVVYQCAGSIWLLESLDAEPVKLDVRLGGVRSGRAPFPVSAKSGLGWFGLCKTGRVAAAEVRGTVHWLPAEDGPARALLTTPGVRGRNPAVVPGTSTVLTVSDADGEDGLDLLSADGAPARRIGHGEFGRVLELAVSPDGKTAAAAAADGRLLTVDLASGEVAELARSGNAEMHGLAFSPDSRYLAWAEPWRPFDGRHVRMARLSDREVVDVTPPRYSDTSPAFTHDGKYLVFLSNRAYDPVYDSHNFDLGFLPGVRPYLVTLDETTPSPFAPELNGRPVNADRGKDAGKGKDAEKNGKGKDADAAAEDDGSGSGGSEGRGGGGGAEPPEVQVDFEGIADRIVPFPVEAGYYESLSAVKGGVVWMVLPRTGELGEAIIGAAEEHPKARLLRYDLGKRKRLTAVRELDAYSVSYDGARLAWRNGADFRIMATDADDDDDAVAVDLDRIRVTVDPPAEWAQMYGEAWRLMRDNFWRADMGGVDWPAMAERYRPLLDRIGSQDDLHDVLWELQGELAASHAYVRPPASGADDALAQGLLGADLERDEDGTWRIARILRGESSVIRARSPLTAPGVGARLGDAIVAVDGRPVDPVRGPNALLGGKADKPVELTLRRDAAEESGESGSEGEGESTERRVVVVPLESEAALRYQDLIAQRRAAVTEASGGKLGYLHVPDMVSSGWAEFHRDIHSQFRRDGLIVDLRENGGGHTSELVVEKLARKIIGWDRARYNEPTPYPSEAPRGPIVALTDEHAGSDGDIVTQALKSYGIAPVVGTRTWGGVIGIDGRYELVDGTGVTQPKFAFWFEDAGWGVENYGVDPDVEVSITPQDWAAGRDPQLDTAIRMALEALETTPAATPPAVE
ncbi:MAG TPA: S41 family peptidase [Actinocrinis sp.]|nr:S41 family peptidase [Actinocrinis sp.]